MKEAATPALPLAALAGAVPPAPKWFVDATAYPCETFSVPVEGARIDCRAWGDRGKPGLVFLHGAAAHLGWWAFLAPFFAQTHRVVAFSLSGMGASDWRDGYSVADFAAEALAAAEVGGAFLDGPPTFVGHSAGGLPVLRIAARDAPRVRAAIIIDTILPSFAPDGLSFGRSHRVQSDLADALGRFRLDPPQPCDNLFVMDYLARMGLKQVEGGWSWRFDPKFLGVTDWGDNWDDLKSVGTPFAVLRGARSMISGGEFARQVADAAPANTIFVDIPEAHHHVMIDQPMALVSTLRTLLGVWG